MMHISCDGCGQNLTDNGLEHFVVKIEAYAKHNSTELTEDDLLADHLEEMNELLSTTEDEDLAPPPTYKKLRYDLCPKCQKKFMANPLAREVKKFNFSEN